MISVSRRKKQVDIAYVYILIDPRNQQPFYVGKTDNPTNRIHGHIADGRKCRVIGAGTKPSIIREILDTGAEPTMRVIEITTPAYIDDRELCWYELLKSRGYKITGEVLARVNRPIEEPVETPPPTINDMSLEEMLDSIGGKDQRRAIVQAAYAFMSHFTDKEKTDFLDAAHNYVTRGQ